MSPEVRQDQFARACAGHQSAVHSLVVDCQPILLHLIRRHFSRRIRHLCDPEDCLQSTSLNLLIHPWQDQAITTVAGMFAFFTRTAVDSVRQAKRSFLFAHKRNARIEVALGDDQPSHTPSAEQVDEGREWLENYLLSLSPEMQQVVTLKSEGYTTSEVSRLLGVAYWRIHTFLVHERRRLHLGGEPAVHLAFPEPLPGALFVDARKLPRSSAS